MKKSNADAKDFIKAKRERDVAQKKLEAARAAGDPNKLAWTMATLSGMTTSTLALVEKAPLSAMWVNFWMQFLKTRR